MRLIIYFIFLLIPTLSFSQKKTLVNFSSTPATEVFSILEKKYEVKISYADSILKNKVITYANQSSTLAEVLDHISEKLNIDFQLISDRYIVATQGNLFQNASRQLAEVVITRYLTSGITKNKDASFTLKPKQLEILPGLTEADVLESIQELPGVISPTETATGLIVRGGNSDENQVIWDGINIYHNGHLFGMISAFNPNITQNVTFINKGTNPRYGDRISSVIDISTDNALVEKAKIGFGLNGVSGDAYIYTPLVKDKLSLMLSYRKSYEGIFETSTFEKLEQKIYQNTKIYDNDDSEESIYFRDYNIKLNYVLNKNNFLSASFIHIDNDLEHNNTLSDDESFRDVLDTENNGYSLNWEKRWSSNIKQYSKISRSNYLLNYNFIKIEDETPLSDFKKENQIKDTDFLTELAIQSKSNNKISLGYQLTNKNVSYSFTETTNLQYVLDSKRATVNTHALYGNYSVRSLKSIDVDLGLRTNYYRELGEIKVEPRFLALKNITDYLKLQVTGEIKNQIISQIEETVLSDLPLENKLWRLADGSNTSPIINSKQVSVGLLFHKNGWSFDLDTYYKKVTGISTLSLGFLNSNLNRFHDGKQKIIGSDLYIKKDFNTIKTWISYSFNNIDNQFNGINNNVSFTSGNEIKQALSISGAYKTQKFQIALGWKWHIGKPYSMSTIDPLNGNVIFNGINTGNLPNYHRLDLSAVYNFSISSLSNINGKIGFSIRNLYNQKNHLSKEYLGNNIPNDPIIVIDKYSLSLVPNFLLRFYW